VTAALDRETRLLIHCARAAIEPERADRIRELVAGKLNWARLLTLAERNGLRPLLYWHLSRIGAASVPSATFECLRDYFHKNGAFNLLLTGELLRLLAALKEHGIDAVPFKGPAMAVRLFGHLALRQFCDLDILVRPRDVWHASEVIQGRGYEPQHRFPDRRRATLLRQDYVRLFHRDARRSIVELHWGVAPRSFAVRFEADALWPRLEALRLLGQTVFVPCAEDLVLMLCIHGSRHGWDKLEGLCSLAELIRGTDAFDWPYVWRKARQMRCRRMLAFALHLVHGLFDVPLPREAADLSHSPGFQAMGGAVVRDFHLDDVQWRTPARQALLHLRLKDSYADCARYCAGLVLTATPDDWAAVRLRGPLSFAYPLVRAIRVARKHAFTLRRAEGGS
jgi:hypothetical protein